MTFIKSSRPRTPGAYVNFVVAQKTRVTPSQGSIVAIEGVHDWGPFKTPTLADSWEEFQAIWGDTETTELAKAVKQAFIGENVLNRAGAGGVLVCRWGGSAGAKATKTLQNTAGSPANAIKLDAKYEGVRGNRLRVTTRDHAADSSQAELLLYDGTVLLETYIYADADIASLVAEINANSDWVTATLQQDGVALGLVTSQVFASGADGTSLAGQDWTDIMSALAINQFGVFAPANLTDGSTLASLVAWSQAQQAAGRRFMSVVGGAAGESASTAITRAQSIADPNFVCLGVGTAIDDELGALSTAQLAPRVAGIIAARGDGKGLSMARLGGISAITGGVSTGKDALYDAGVTFLQSDPYTAAPVRLDKGVTAWGKTAAAADTSRPYDIFSNPKFVRSMQLLEDEIEALAAAPGFLGELPVNDRTRTWAVGEVKTMLLARETPERAAFQPGSTVAVDQDPPPSDDDEFIALKVGLKFGRDAEQFYLSVTVG